MTRRRDTLRVDTAVQLGEEARRAFDSEWDALVADGSGLTTFQTAAWYRSWLESAGFSRNIEPIIVRAPAQGRLRAACALQLVQRSGVDCLEPLSTPWADYHDAVGAAEADCVAALAAGLAHLGQKVAIILDDLKPGGLLHRAAEAARASITSSSHTGSLNLASEGDVSKILADPEFVRKERRMRRLGVVELHHLTDRASKHEALDRLIDMHTREWATKANTIAAFDGGVVDKTFRSLIDGLAEEAILVSELRVNGVVTASYFGMRHGDWYGGYRTAFDSNFYRYSPGHLLLREMIRTLPALGINRLDLMRGDYAYKQAYARQWSRNLRATIPSQPQRSHSQGSSNATYGPRPDV